ncbi:CRISP [Lepeophtheirus salmonis]|uniref:CRISP n=1 Tax=Lepeophtheirus salmonis TaxID=72036 RepID=A0A7R8CR98_LEPSM|nr:CRISP [Lepeophtheirus salmonis]CAF2903262.1 CRISP [Lepeophtheirus salmonis]
MWESTCFKYSEQRWCMISLGQLRPCTCENKCCTNNLESGSSGSGGGNSGSSGSSGETEEEGSESGGSGEGSEGGSSGSSGSSGGTEEGSSESGGSSEVSGACDSTSVKDYKGCKDLKKIYCKLTATQNGVVYKNTLCKYCGENQDTCKGKICAHGIISKEDQKRIVSIHNKHRSKVALGKEKRGVGGPQPPAANMYRLDWDDELAKGAQMWALQCPKGHDKNRITPEFSGENMWVGQNMASAWSSVKSMNRDYEGMIKGWYDEVKDFPAKNVKHYSTKGATGVVGHYTAMVWGNSVKVGCGYVMYYDTTQPRYPYKKVLICNYGPGGNILRAKVYEIGKAGSECPNGHKDGLCNH